MDITFNKGYAGMHPSEFKRPGSAEHMFNGKGEMNASNRTEVASGQTEFMAALSSGQVLPSSQKQVPLEVKAQYTKLNKVLCAALNTNNATEIKQVVASMANLVYEYAQRDGFTRKFLKQISVEQGQLPMLSSDTKTILGYTFDAGGTNVVPVTVRDKKFYLQEFQIIVKTFLDIIEYHQSTTNFFENKLTEMKEQAMVQEDKRWKALADATLGSINGGNDLQLFTSGLSASVIGTMRALLDDAKVPPQYLLIAANLIKDFYGPLGNTIDLFHYYQVLETGMLGNIAGLTVLTDATRVTTQKVLNSGEMYVISNPEYHGAYSDRAGLEVLEYNPALTENGKTGKGWTCFEILSMIVSNPRSIAKGLVS